MLYRTIVLLFTTISFARSGFASSTNPFADDRSSSTNPFVGYDVSAPIPPLMRDIFQLDPLLQNESLSLTGISPKNPYGSHQTPHTPAKWPSLSEIGDTIRPYVVPAALLLSLVLFSRHNSSSEQGHPGPSYGSFLRAATGPCTLLYGLRYGLSKPRGNSWFHRLLGGTRPLYRTVVDLRTDVNLLTQRLEKTDKEDDKRFTELLKNFKTTVNHHKDLERLTRDLQSKLTELSQGAQENYNDSLIIAKKVENITILCQNLLDKTKKFYSPEAREKFFTAHKKELIESCTAIIRQETNGREGEQNF